MSVCTIVICSGPYASNMTQQLAIPVEPFFPSSTPFTTALTSISSFRDTNKALDTWQKAMLAHLANPA